MARATQASNASTPAAYREALRLRSMAAAVFRRLHDQGAEGEALSWAALSWFQLGEGDSARRIAHSAVALRMAAGDSAGAARTLNGVLAPAFETLGQIDSAQATYYRAYSIASRRNDPALLARVAQNIGSFYITQSNGDSALAWLGKTMAIARGAGDRRLESETLNNLSALHRDLGTVDSALSYGRQASNLAAALRNDSLLANTELNLGAVFTQLSEGDSALAAYRRGIAAAERAPTPDLRRQALVDVGIVLQQLGQRDSAKRYYREAIRLSQEVKDQALEARALSNLGTALLEESHADSAGAIYRRVIAIYRPLSYRRGEGIAVLNLANVFLVQKQQDSVIAYGREAYAIGRELEFPALESSALNAIGQAFHNLNQPDSALRYLQLDLELSKKLGDPRGIGNSYIILGEVLATSSRPALALATAYLDSAAALKKQIARSAGGDFNRTTFGEHELELYDVWTRSWLARSSELGPAEAAAGGLGALEQGRAQALLDLMDRADSTGERPEAAMLGRSLVERVVRNGTALLEYYVSADTLFVWTAGPQSPLTVTRTPVGRDSLAGMVQALRIALGVEGAAGRVATRGALEGETVPLSAAPTAAAWLAPDRQLAGLLLPSSTSDVLAGARELLVVPSGNLGLVPFTLLRGAGDPATLGERIAVRYAPSLATALAAEARPALTRGPSLVVGNPFMPRVVSAAGDTVGLSPLPGAAGEATEIGKRLGSAVLSGASASETTVRSQLATARVVHLATHGYAYADENSARRSFVALAPDSSNDGLLTVGDLLDDTSLRLSAELVTLSACQTGLGDFKQAEGTVGLQRAFLARGARSVLVSLWSVSDAATRLLMERFYAHFLGDADTPGKALALARAQADVRSTRGFEHPRYWGGFQLVGAR